MRRIFLSILIVVRRGRSLQSDQLGNSKAAQTGRKSPVQIRFEILEFLFYNAGPHSKTSLWRHATNLSYDDFQKYLDYLKGKGYLQESEGTIRLSTEGRNIYVKLRETLPSIL